LRTFYNPSGFVYYINSYADDHGNSKETHNYYGDGTLKDSYNVADYPFLDVAFTVNENDHSWTLAGSDMSKVSLAGMYYKVGSSDYNQTTQETTSRNLHISISWTVAPSQMPHVELVDVIPSEVFADANATVNGDNNYENFFAYAEEYKGQTEASLLDLVAGSSSTAFSGQSLYNSGVRSVHYNPEEEGGFSALSAENKKAKRDTSLFSINLNPKHVSSK